MTNDQMNSICNGIKKSAGDKMRVDFPSLSPVQIDSFTDWLFLDVKLQLVSAEHAGLLK